jgi:hypothetical protein
MNVTTERERSADLPKIAGCCESTTLVWRLDERPVCPRPRGGGRAGAKRAFDGPAGHPRCCVGAGPISRVLDDHKSGSLTLHKDVQGCRAVGVRPSIPPRPKILPSPIGMEDDAEPLTELLTQRVVPEVRRRWSLRDSSWVPELYSCWRRAS